MTIKETAGKPAARKVNWGVLSTAKIGRVHVIPAMQQGERSVVAAIASRDAATARKVADDLGIERAYGSYEALLAAPDIDAIYNPLPNHLHVPWTIKALEAGKHVLCEKPVALNAEDAALLVEASARTGKIVAEAFMVRHHPQWKAARELVQGGRIGEARAIQTVFAYHLTDPGNIRNNPEIGGGGLYDIGCYAIATARYLFGGEPERVVASFDIDPDMGTDRMATGIAEFSGARHLAFTSATQLAPAQRVTVLGTKGRIEIEIPFNSPIDRPTRILVDDGRDLFGTGRELIELPVSNQYTLQGDAVSAAILGGPPLEVGIEDAVLNMRVIDAFFRSAASGSWERP
ncbi:MULTISPECIES: Gfo/Idh/MocA family protein [unclassified Aureimonas]|uniref:Gfo/Idh/MocA family protein n=1 Tax=unclassified Aureimonas TaxID=2615206 RepID=UPI0006F4C164|nr:MULTISPECIES: Gfo/Idh/MocA family oxidoreductase [unclassified Aureimonas]KQT64045.1 NAD-binding protein [Aureimonas sp. Leaf427]KQT81683.1 NAD-binding protein [Aureimonas sp. Leaf460]